MKNQAEGEQTRDATLISFTRVFLLSRRSSFLFFFFSNTIFSISYETRVHVFIEITRHSRRILRARDPASNRGKGGDSRAQLIRHN